MNDIDERLLAKLRREHGTTGGVADRHRHSHFLQLIGELKCSQFGTFSLLH
jgi:hypothetical protein